MINAERILTTLDRHLDHNVDLVIYGRAALALGFDPAPDAFELAKPRVREIVRNKSS